MDKGSKKTKKLYTLVNARISEMESPMKYVYSLFLSMRKLSNVNVSNKN